MIMMMGMKMEIMGMILAITPRLLRYLDQDGEDDDDYDDGYGDVDNGYDLGNHSSTAAVPWQ